MSCKCAFHPSVSAFCVAQVRLSSFCSCLLCAASLPVTLLFPPCVSCRTACHPFVRCLLPSRDATVMKGDSNTKDRRHPNLQLAPPSNVASHGTRCTMFSLLHCILYSSLCFDIGSRMMNTVQGQGHCWKHQDAIRGRVCFGCCCRCRISLFPLLLRLKPCWRPKSVWWRCQLCNLQATLVPPWG